VPSQSEFETEDTTVAINVHVIEPMREFVRCRRMASGRVVYEFTTAKSGRFSRVDADVYEAALAHARANLTEEPADDA
jgi:ABC-type phosphate/phosphonate transport system ATPase subunit